MKDLNLNKSTNKLLIFILSTLVFCLFGSTTYLIDKWVSGMTESNVRVSESINSLNTEVGKLKTILDYINKDVQDLKKKNK